MEPNQIGIKIEGAKEGVIFFLLSTQNYDQKVDQRWRQNKQNKKCLGYPMVSSHPTVSSHGQAGEDQKADGDHLVIKKNTIYLFAIIANGLFEKREKTHKASLKLMFPKNRWSHDWSRLVNLKWFDGCFDFFELVSNHCAT